MFRGGKPFTSLPIIIIITTKGVATAATIAGTSLLRIINRNSNNVVVRLVDAILWNWLIPKVMNTFSRNWRKLSNSVPECSEQQTQPLLPATTTAVTEALPLQVGAAAAIKIFLSLITDHQRIISHHYRIGCRFRIKVIMIAATTIATIPLLQYRSRYRPS